MNRRAFSARVLGTLCLAGAAVLLPAASGQAEAIPLKYRGSFDYYSQCAAAADRITAQEHIREWACYPGHPAPGAPADHWDLYVS